MTVTINGTASQGDASGDMLTGFENLIGSAHDDILTGDSGDNVIEGLAGADKLDGGTHSTNGDTLSYASSNAGVTIDLNEGDGNFDPGISTIKTSSGGHAAGDNVRFQSFENITGSAHADTLTGDNGVNTLTGGAGNDRLMGDDGDDTLNGGPGGDTLDGGDGDMDRVTYADATEGVTVNLSSVSERNNVITISNSGGRGDASGDRFIDVELFIGSPHDDTFIAGPEDDNINAGDGADTISYERSSRYPVIVDISTPAQAGDGSATVPGRPSDYEPYEMGDVLTDFENIIGTNVSSTGTNGADVNGTGNEFHDVLTGNDEANIIDGRGGNDEISGAGGNDRLIGGSGNDSLTGGGGDDTFVISGRDTITDFAPGEDKLNFGSSPRILNLNYSTDGTNLVISLSGRQVTLPGRTDVTGLSAADFDFSPDGYVRLTDSTTGAETRGDYTIYGGEGDNSLTGGSNDDTINGNGGDDNINGGNGDDDIDGGNGDDIIEGGAGADMLDGGESTGDSDTLSYAGSPSGPTTGADLNPRNGVTVTLNSDPVATDNTRTHAEGDTSITGFENLTGSRYNDLLIGDNGVNIIKGGSGHDIIRGAGAGSEMEGGSGRDKLEGVDGAFLSYAGSGSGVNVDLSDTSDVTLSTADAALFGVATVTGVIKVSGGDATGDIATGFNDVIGGRGSDTLTGNDQDNELRGMGGNDTLTGGVGNDDLKGGEGRDTLRGGTGADTLDGGPGADILDGGGTDGDNENDTATYASAMEGVTVDLSGGNRGQGDAAGDSFEHIELYVGSSNADIFIAGDDADNITGGPAGDTSIDTVSYARSDEGVTVDLGTPAQSTAADNGYASGDTLNNVENVIGSNHRDILTAFGTGSSVITGGRGDDSLTAAGSNDTFVFAPGDGDDEITGFDDAGDDKIDLSAFTSIASLDDLKDTNNSNGEISETGTAVEINLPSNGEIRLTDVTDADTLTADNFIFYTKPISGNMGDRFNNEINGGSGADAIYGEQGRDIINGGGGNDEIYGGEDKDTINGGEGDDWLDGGPGDDTFVFEPGNGNDVIMDFTTGTGAGADKIDLSAFTDAEGAALTAAPDSIAGDADYTIDLSAYGGGMITILGAADATIDFMFS